METLKFIIVTCYIIAMFLSVAGLTIVFLAGKKRKSELNTALKLFMFGLLMMSIYDMAIYYTNYSLGGLANTVALRVGISIMAVLFYLWLNLLQKIMGQGKFLGFHRGAGIFIGIYAVFWLVTSIILPTDAFYTIRWILFGGGYHTAADSTGGKCDLHEQGDDRSREGYLSVHDTGHIHVGVELRILFLGRGFCVLGEQSVYQRTFGLDYYLLVRGEYRQYLFHIQGGFFRCI